MPSSLHKLGVQLESRDDTANVFWHVWVMKYHYHILMERDREQSSFSTRIGSYATRKGSPHWNLMRYQCVRGPQVCYIYHARLLKRRLGSYYVLFDDANGLNWCKICFQSKKLNFTTSPSRCNKRYTLPFVLIRPICKVPIQSYSFKGCPYQL